MTKYHKNDPQSIQKMFGSIAQRYDTANAILSLQLHKFWNARLVQSVSTQPHPGILLDLCCGTGDIAFTYLKRSHAPQKAILLDFCPEMLECAKYKAAALHLNQHDLQYIQADVHQIPLENRSASAATMAYGIRNVKSPLVCFREVYRVLQPGGIFGILELTKPSNPLIRAGHSCYLKLMLPLLGKWITSNQEAYQYLCNSIHDFAAPAQLEQQLHQAGFNAIVQKPLAFGIATILLARKS